MNLNELKNDLNRFRRDSKGNVVAMVVATIIVVIVIAAFIVTFYQTPAPTVPISTALSETKISVNKALALGISEWAETGFDQEQPTWYNNGDFPASLEEAKQSLRDSVKAEIDQVLEELESQRGYTYEFDDPVEGVKLEFDFDDAATTGDLDKESVTVTISGFSVRDERGNVVTVKEFETEEKFDYSVWGLYSEMHEWAQDDSGGISDNLQMMLDSAPYQVQLCECGIITNVTEDSVILNASVTWEDRIDPDTSATIQGVKSFVVDPALANLQARFADKPSVTCHYTVEDKAIENIPNIIRRGQAGCECAGGAGLENEPGVAASGWRTDEVGKPELYYGVMESDEDMRDNVSSGNGFSTVESYLRIERTDAIPPLVYTNCSEFSDNPEDEGLCNAGKICFHTDQACIDAYEDEDTGEPYLTLTGDNEVIGMTRRIAALVRFKCEDSTSRVKTEEEFKNLSAEVLIRFAVLKGAEPPDFCTTETGPVCEYGAAEGGGGGPVDTGPGPIIGPDCTPWETCSSDAGDAAACNICECMVGSQIIDSGDYDGSDEVEWCSGRGGAFACPATEEFDGTTASCQAIIEQTISGGRSEQCLEYSCEVEGNTVMRGCAFNDAPVSCDSCRVCNPAGFCVANAAQEGQMCVPQPRPAGAVQDCYNCTSMGDCVVNAGAIGVEQCSNSRGCLTYCAADGTCTNVNNADIGIACPRDNDDYECRTCTVSNNKLVCGSSCDQGCCSGGGWGRCMNPDGKCCPETRTLTDCPTST